MQVVDPSDLKVRVLQFLRDEVAPVLQVDGSTIEVCEVSSGVAQVRLGSACGCCPGSLMAVLMGVEQELRRRIPEVEYLEVVP
jgi:Fe-S cluster biogenesis protein NfuA